jgi:hypothetical protein
MPPATQGYDDVYILSIPSFTWIKWFPSDDEEVNPHHSLTCNVVNQNQMIVMGGTFPNSSQCDAPDLYGLHNLDLSQNNPNNAMWAPPNYSSTGYLVPTAVISAVGGG